MRRKVGPVHEDLHLHVIEPHYLHQDVFGGGGRHGAEFSGATLLVDQSFNRKRHHDDHPVVHSESLVEVLESGTTGLDQGDAPSRYGWKGKLDARNNGQGIQRLVPRIDGGVVCQGNGNHSGDLRQDDR